MTTWSEERKAELIRRWAAKETPKHIREAMGLTPGQLAGRTTKWNLHMPRERRRNWKADHPLVVQGRTRYPHMVTDTGEALKTGRYQIKVGGRVTKGAWKGMPIFTLTLEERATCPRSCMLWVACYGNTMNWAKRMRHGPALEAKIDVELARLSRMYRRGFVVRLHILGDFYSRAYVLQWIEWLRKYPALRVYGYTAHEVSSPIGATIRAAANGLWERFAVRTSGALRGLRTVVVDTYEDAARLGAIVCPAQSESLLAAGKQINCGTCALCWSTKRPIAFLLH